MSPLIIRKGDKVIRVTREDMHPGKFIPGEWARQQKELEDRARATAVTVLVLRSFIAGGTMFVRGARVRVGERFHQENARFLKIIEPTFEAKVEGPSTFKAQWPTAMSPKRYIKRHPYGRHAELARKILEEEEHLAGNGVKGF